MKSGWVTKKLGEVCDSFNGIWKGTQPPLKNVGVIRATNFTKQCEFDPSRTVFIDVEEKKFNKRKLEFGDIIVERSGGGPGQPVGRVIFFNLQAGDYTISNFTSALRVKDKTLLDPYYLHRALVAKYFSGATEKMQSNSIHIINLNYSAYLELEIPIPPLAEQKRIVAKIDAAFEKIDALKANAEKNLANAKELFQSALDEAMRPKPGWVEKRLGEVCEILDSQRIPITKKDRKPGKIPYYGATKQVDSVSDYIFDERLLLLGEDGADWSAGANSAYIIEGKSWVNNHAHVLRPIAGVVNDVWLMFYLNATDLTKWVSGTTVPKLNQKNMCEIPVPIPPINEQEILAKRIELFSSKLETLQQNYSQQISGCAEMRQAILREAFEGRL